MRNRKLISLALATVMLMTLSFPISATEAAPKEVLVPGEAMDIPGIMEMANSHITDVNADAAEFKLVGTDFFGLTLGNKLPFYQETESGLVV